MVLVRAVDGRRALALENCLRSKTGSVPGLKALPEYGEEQMGLLLAKRLDRVETDQQKDLCDESAWNLAIPAWESIVTSAASRVLETYELLERVRSGLRCTAGS